MITEINGKKIHIYEEFQLYNLTHSTSDTAELTFERDGKEHTIQMENDSLGMRPQREWDLPILQRWRNRDFQKYPVWGIHGKILGRVHAGVPEDAPDG